MSSTETPAPRAARARPSRDEAEQARRRRRQPNDNGQVMRLGVPEDKLDRTRYAYRWVNDLPGRIRLLYGQDWDLVETSELGPDYAPERHADVAQNRVALTTRLMRKPIELHEEDQAAKQKTLDAEMKAAELGQQVLNGASGEGLNANDPRVYVPNPQANKL